MTAGVRFSNKYARKEVLIRRGDEAQGEELIPSGCCSQRECGRLQAVFRRKSNAVDPEEYLPYPESSASHCRLNLMARPLM